MQSSAANEAMTALVLEFADCVVRQRQAVAEGNATVGNRFAHRYIAAFEKLRGYGDVGRDALSVLLSDSRAEVRVLSAACLLRHCEERARAILEHEATGNGLVAFGAAQTLRRWEEGTWALGLE